MDAVLKFNWWDDFGRWDFDPSSMPLVGMREVAAWMSDDIWDLAGANRMIDRLHGIKSGIENKGYIGTGNAHHIYSFEDKIYLSCEYVEDLKVVLSIDEAIKALEGYAKFKGGNWKSQDYHPSSIEFSYDFEGVEAESRYAASGLPWGMSQDEIKENTDLIEGMDKKKNN